MGKRRWRVITAGMFLIFFTVYCGVYLNLRRNHYIIHRSTFIRGNETYSHSVGMGDFGPGIPRNDILIAAIITQPLQWLETSYWYLRYPKGGKWPY